jgi:hypothetical protein
MYLNRYEICLEECDISPFQLWKELKCRFQGDLELVAAVISEHSNDLKITTRSIEAFVELDKIIDDYMRGKSSGTQNNKGSLKDLDDRLELFEDNYIEVIPGDACMGSRVILAQDLQNEDCLCLIVGNDLRFMSRDEAVKLRRRLDAWCFTGDFNARDLELSGGFKWE